MLNNIKPVEELRGLARSKRLEYSTKTISSLLLPQAEAEGWIVEKRHAGATYS